LTNCIDLIWSSVFRDTLEVIAGVFLDEGSGVEGPMFFGYRPPTFELGPPELFRH
jgi:hypothetical protein